MAYDPTVNNIEVTWACGHRVLTASPGVSDPMGYMREQAVLTDGRYIFYDLSECATCRREHE